MKFKVGDKVKFLNEKGGGIVSKIISGSLVYVATEDGFELPTSTTDIISINPESKAELMFTEDFNVNMNDQVTIGSHGAAGEQLSTRKVKPGAEETAGVYLAFVPDDQQWFITGDLEIRIINHTRHDILYNLLLEDTDGKYFGFDYGSVEAQSSSVVESIDREALPDWADGMIQILLHSEEQAYLPVQSNFHIKAGKFVSEGSYQESGLIREKAILYRLAVLKSFKKLAGKKEAIKVEDEPIEVTASEHKRETFIGRHAVSPREAVVDLHIGEIVNNIAGLSSHDMFLTQINYFVKAMDSAIENKFRKVTFIHGIGNGVLKNAIVEKLKEYDGTEKRSASLASFGQGALDILIYDH
jgi:hypothetical protein